MRFKETIEELVAQLNQLEPHEIIPATYEYADALYEVYKPYFEKIVRFQIAEHLRDSCVKARRGNVY